MTRVLIAFGSGVAVETFFSFGVLMISQRRRMIACVTSSLWGVAMLTGIGESFHGPIVGGAWCVGLGVGCALGMWLEHRLQRSPQNQTFGS